jgi:uncharacterized protein YhhL (DUF1145 family)
MKTINLIKCSLLFVWFICLLNLAFSMSDFINYLLIFLVVAHVLEFFVFFNKIKEQRIKNFFLVLIFGYLHLQQLDYNNKNKI